MRKRKSPIKHTVRTHTRKGKRVRSFSRGHGVNRPHTIKRRLLKHEGTSRKTLEKYTITFYYSGNRKEQLVMGARDSDDALNQALKVRKYKSLKPIKIKIDDSIASVAAAIASGVTQFVGGVVTGVGTGIAKTSVEAEKQITIIAAQREEAKAMSKAEQIKRRAAAIEHLIKLTSSNNPNIRNPALKELRKRYPEAHGRLALEAV